MGNLRERLLAVSAGWMAQQYGDRKLRLQAESTASLLYEAAERIAALEADKELSERDPAHENCRNVEAQLNAQLREADKACAALEQERDEARRCHAELDAYYADKRRLRRELEDALGVDPRAPLEEQFEQALESVNGLRERIAALEACRGCGGALWVCVGCGRQSEEVDRG